MTLKMCFINSFLVMLPMCLSQLRSAEIMTPMYFAAETFKFCVVTHITYNLLVVHEYCGKTWSK